MTGNLTSNGETFIQKNIGESGGNLTKSILGLSGILGGTIGITKVPFKPVSTGPIDNIIGLGGDLKSTIESGRKISDK
ncbi:hypothetical protein ACFCT7_08920 [Fulvivirgaceae bacterium LMO-SS25]